MLPGFHVFPVPSGLLPLYRRTGYPPLVHLVPFLSTSGISLTPWLIGSPSLSIIPGEHLWGPQPWDLTSPLSFKTLPDASSHSASSPQEALYDTLSPSIPPTLKFPPGPLYSLPLRLHKLSKPGPLYKPRAPQFHAPPPSSVPRPRSHSSGCRR